MGYAMACVEIVSENSERAGAIYRDMLDAWGKPGIKTLYNELISVIPELEKRTWRKMLPLYSSLKYQVTTERTSGCLSSDACKYSIPFSISVK